MKCDKSIDDQFLGIATVGERGQLVIPAEARKKFGINPGDKILLMDHPVGSGLLLLKVDAMREFISDHLERLTRLEEMSLNSNGDGSDNSAG